MKKEFHTPTIISVPTDDKRREQLRVAFKEEIIVLVDKGEKYFYATTSYISSRRIWFTCETLLEQGKRVDFTLETERGPLVLNAKVMRCKKVQEGVFKYSCKFDRFPNCIEKSLKDYVTQIQQNHQ